MGAVELPGDLITIFMMEWLGRRHTTVFSLIFSGVAAISIIFLRMNDTVLLLCFAVAGRFFITMAINVGQQYIIEILPTAGRAQGSAAIHTVGLGMAFVSPYIVYLSKFKQWYPYLIFGLIS
ncbi:Solute carrier family 22 member 16, partial [Armadillidium nasatum]